ncbi:MAG: response regulator [Nevskia sp.]|nr:response regulator [Nevskia sp.]
MTEQPAAAAAARPDNRPRIRILCVDDDPNVLAGLAQILRRYFDVQAATSAAGGIEALKRDRDIAVILSDMRMPRVDGAAFLKQARELAPEATRMLLTGEADIQSAIAAVNDGQIFRFLTKPCPPPVLLTAIAAAVDQHRLVTAERVLLEQTLHGSIKALIDVLSLTNPLAFGRAVRTKQLISDMTIQLGMTQRWQVEIAGMLSQLGTVVLPQETVERMYYALALDEEEQQMAGRMAATTDQLLAHIPRLELVREILARYFDPKHVGIWPLLHEQSMLAETGAALLRAAVDFDVLEAQGSTPTMAIDIMRTRSPPYRGEVLNALVQVRGAAGTGREVRELPLSAVRIGMVFAEDVKLDTGTLFVARGHEVTQGLIERIRVLRAGAVKGAVRVIVPSAALPG